VHTITSSGLGSAFITGALAGALGAKTAGIIPQGGLTAEKLASNVGIGEATYAVGQVTDEGEGFVLVVGKSSDEYCPRVDQCDEPRVCG